MKYLRFCLCVLWCLSACLVRANVGVSVSLDSTILVIGDQSGMSMSINQPMDKYVAFPLFVDTLPGGLEVVGQAEVDTLKKDNYCIVTHRYQVTAVEDSLYLLSPLPFVCEGETIWSDPVALKVIQPFEVDTASHMLADIKDIYRAPIYWWGIIRIVLFVLLLLALIGLGYYLYRRFAKREHKEDIIVEEEVRDPWEVALEGLERIKGEKIWQQAGRQKVYFTELTDVLRIYAEGTFGVNCMELPSSDILKELAPLLKENREAYGILKDVLNMADLVKFAKWTALPEECEGCLKKAYNFLEITHEKKAAPLTTNANVKNE